MDPIEGFWAVPLYDAHNPFIPKHEGKKSLEVYQHLSRESVEEAYQTVMKSVGV
jgi:hypothetical protein